MIYFPCDSSVVVKIYSPKGFYMKLFLAAMLLCCIWSLSGSETVTYRSSSGVLLQTSDILRKLERFLKEIFPGSYYRKTPLIIDITGPGSPLPPVPGERLEIKADELEKFSLETLSLAGSAILRAHGKAPAEFQLPLFLCAAFRHRERSLKKEGRFLGNNRRLNSLEALFQAEAELPLTALLSPESPDSDPVLARWYDDHARVLLELLRSRNFRGKAPELLPAAEKLLKSGSYAGEIRALLWHNFKLLPSHLLRKELNQLQQFELPRLDHNGEPNGLFETLSVSLAPEKLRKHPLREEVLRTYAAQVLKTAANCPRFIQGVLRELHDSANALSKAAKPELEVRFTTALAEVERSFQLHSRRAKALDEAAANMENPVRLLHTSLTENSRPGEISTPETARFLQRWNEYYNSN